MRKKPCGKQSCSTKCREEGGGAGEQLAGQLGAGQGQPPQQVIVLPVKHFFNVLV